MYDMVTTAVNKSGCDMDHTMGRTWGMATGGPNWEG